MTMLKEELFCRLDEYCRRRWLELGARRLERPMLKTYVLETGRNVRALPQLLDGLGTVTLIGDGVSEIADRHGLVAHVEDLGRFRLLYTFLPVADIEPTIQRLVRDSQFLDHLWLSGEIFDVLFDYVKSFHRPWRHVRMAMGYDPLFELPVDYLSQETRWASPEKENSRAEPSAEPPDLSMEDEDSFLSAEYDASPGSRLQLSNRLDRVAALEQLLSQAPELRNITMLRVPARATTGGHEFYHTGKITNRSGDFFDHRATTLAVVDMYRRATEAMEDSVWLEAENGSVPSKVGIRHISGSPVTISFKDPLSEYTFHRFLDVTFNKGRGPFRLWGNLLHRGRDCYHVYGLDLHLVQEIILELTPRRFLLFMPQATCGNTIHRLVTNTQRYLAPEVQVSIGSVAYSDYVREAFFQVEPPRPTSPN